MYGDNDCNVIECPAGEECTGAGAGEQPGYVGGAARQRSRGLSEPGH